MTKARRLLGYLSNALAPLTKRFARKKADPWEHIRTDVPFAAYGPGSRHDFTWYFEGESGVNTGTLEEIQDWLLACEYVHDPDLFHEKDFWQHPRTFEKLRQGDCEDHALWAWRKLVELGIDAEFVCGRVSWPEGEGKSDSYHAWVVFRHDADTFVLEATCKSREKMIRPLAEVRHNYRPSLGVDSKRERFAFSGALTEDKGRTA